MHHPRGPRTRHRAAARPGTAQLTGARRALLVGLTAASVGVIYGYDLSIIAGALLFVTDEFDLTTPQQELLTTMVVIGQIGGALVAGVLADAIGRKKSTVLIAVGYAVFALLGAFSVSMPMLLTARLLLGVTIGVSVVVVPVYVAESAPAAVRGSLLTAYQLAIVSGIIVGYLTGYLLAGTHSWRWMLRAGRRARDAAAAVVDSDARHGPVVRAQGAGRRRPPGAAASGARGPTSTRSWPRSAAP